VVDSGAALDVEEVQLACVDGDIDLLARPHARTGAEAADEDRRAFPGVNLRPLGLADVLGELLDVRGERGRRVDREVDHDLGAERLSEGYGALDHPAVCRLARELEILEILGPDPKI